MPPSPLVCTYATSVLWRNMRLPQIIFYLVVTGVGNWDRGLHAGDESVDVVQEDHLNVGLGTDESATSEPDE